MAKATSLFGLAALVTLGCGGGSGGTLDGGTSLGTACKQSCLVTLSNMVAGCQPSGTCTQQLTGTSSGAICYSNGVKFKVTMTSSSSGAMSMSMSAKKGSATCYSMILDETAAGDVTMTLVSRPRRGDSTLTTSPTLCVKPWPGASRSWIGANSVPVNKARPSGY